ncbi:tetratricopeptide repeat protein [Fredinandcohnia humi]
MRHGLEKALLYRSEGKYKESNEILTRLAKDYPDDPYIHYQCAWSCDVLGLEAEAVPYYEKAILLGLAGEDLEGAYLGLGSTYRTLGEYEKSKQTLLKGMELFPENHALRTFYAMTLYNLKEYDRAMELLLRCIVETTVDEKVKSYNRAISFYADKLDQVWK